MTARRWTLLGLAVTGAILGVVEVRALADARPGDTISELVAETGRSQPLAFVAVGACATHFAGGLPSAQRWLAARPLLPLALGALVGALCWPLRGLKG